jgi:co-chaperonin GroES (HSP10)
MKIIQDYFMVLLDQKYNSDVTESGILTLNPAYMEEWAEAHLKHRRQFGKVISAPLQFTDTVVDVTLPGGPEPRLFVSSEHIGEMVNAGYTRIPQYYPSSYDEFPAITLLDIAQKTDIRPGDKVYFDYLATDEDRILGPHKDGILFMIRVDEIYCVVRDGKIIPQGEWCLVRPDMETWEDITSPSGVIMKAAPGAKFEAQKDENNEFIGYKMVIEGKYLQGFIEHIRPRPDLKAGDKILYQRNADYTVIIEGEPLYVMKEEDVLIKI